MAKKILASSSHTGGANATSHVIKRLNEEGEVNIVTIGHQYSEKVFQNSGISYKTISSYGLNDVSVDSMSLLLQEVSPDLVFTGASVQDKDNRNVIEQTLTLAARRRGLKSLAVLDSWGNYSSRFSDIYTGERFRFLPDKIAIMDKLAEETMLREGFDKQRLVITGNPYFDDLIELKEKFGEKDRQRVRTDLNVDLNSYLLLFASQPIKYYYGNQLGYTEKTALKELLDSVKILHSREKINILVKVHPMEDEHDLEKITKKYDLPIVINKPYPIKPAILASDVVISTFSTVLIESSYLDKPSISLQPGLKKSDLLITNQLGVTVPVYERGKIGDILEKLLSDENYVRMLSQKREDFHIDGKATERVTNLIYKMIG